MTVWSVRRGLAAYQGILGAVVVICAGLLAAGCAEQGYSVLAVTGTNVGLEIGMDRASQTPQFKLGYQRGEFAFVPTNRPANEQSADNIEGAGETAQVLMEIRYGGGTGNGVDTSIYQRLAVGNIAVTQPGATVMFAKQPDGGVDTETLMAIEAARVIAAKEFIAERDRQIDVITKCYLEGGNIKQPEWNSAVDALPQSVNVGPRNILKSRTDAEGISSALRAQPHVRESLFKNLPSTCNP